MRKLNTADVFNALRFVSKIGIKEELKSIVGKVGAEKGERDATEIGIDAVMQLLEIVVSKKAEQELYIVLAGPFECEAAEVEAMDFDELMGGLMEIANGGNLKAFFHSVFRLMTRKSAT